MRLARKSIFLLSLLFVSLTEVSAQSADKDLHYKMVYETPEIIIAAGVAYNLQATFLTRFSYPYSRHESLTLGTIHPASDNCIYTRYKTWSDITTRTGKCHDLGARLDESNNTQVNPDQNYTKLFTQGFQGPVNLLFGGLEVKLSPVRSSHRLTHFKHPREPEPVTAELASYIPEGHVTSDTMDGGYEVLEIVSCDKESFSDPREVQCKRGFWMDASTLAWPGNLKKRKLDVNIQSLDDGGMILTFYNFQEAQHGLNIYTYDPRDKSRKNQHKDLRIVVKKTNLPVASPQTGSLAVANTTAYNSTSGAHNHSGMFTTVAPKNIFEIMTALFVVTAATIY